MKCCVSCTNGSSCSAESRQLACELVQMQEEGKIDLPAKHFGVNGHQSYDDGASSLHNVRDMCDGKMARRYIVQYYSSW